LYLNIAGTTRNKKELEDTIEKIKPSIICLTETHITEEIYDIEIQIKNYNGVHVRSESRRTGGCSIYVRNNIRIKKTTEEKLNQGTWIVGTSIEINKKIINLYVIYRSPSTSVNEFLQEYERWMEKIVKKENAILLGDYNIDLLKNSPSAIRLGEIMEATHFLQVNEEATRFNDKSRTLIDIIYSSMGDINCDILDEHKITDHETLCCKIKIPRRNCDLTGERRKIKTIDQNELRKELEKLRETFVIEEENFEETSQQYIELMKENIRKCTKERREKFEKPWMTSREIQRLRREKNYYWNCYKKIKEGHERKEETREKFRQARNKFQKCWREEYRKHNEKKIDENKTDGKKLWSELNKIYSTKTRQEIRKEEIMFEDMSEDNFADKLNKFFVKSIVELQESISQENEDGEQEENDRPVEENDICTSENRKLPRNQYRRAKENSNEVEEKKYV
jgi:hypothetical protein